MSAIQFKNVSEIYRIKFVRDGVVSWEEVPALDDVSLSVARGDVVGIIGPNGAGKTTLLKLIAGMLVPDKGEVKVEGRVSTLMDLGAGFNPEFTGRENIVLNAKLYGIRENFESHIRDIVAFADLGRFIDAPIRYYSHGMFMRLAFALAIFVDPDVLLIDDILAVGDEDAHRKCIHKILDLKKEGRTIVIVSHDMPTISRICDRVLLLERGRLVSSGTPRQMATRYFETLGDERGIAVLASGNLRAVFNNGRLSIGYGGLAVTQETGGCASFFVPRANLWLSSLKLEWHIRSRRDEEMTAEGIDPKGAVSQAWKIRLRQNRLDWEVENKDSAAVDFHTDLFLAGDYKRWVHLENEGEFPSFYHKTQWQGFETESSRWKKGGFVPVEGSGLAYFLWDGTDVIQETLLFNSGYEQEARIIQWRPVKDTVGVTLSFFDSETDFRAALEEQRQRFYAQRQKEQRAQREARTLSFGDMSIVADPERKTAKLFFKDKELTAGGGLHTSFLLQESWQDSSVCRWRVEKERDVLVLHLFHDALNFVQTWRFSLDEDGLEWRVDLSSDHALPFQFFKTGVYLLEDYRVSFCGLQEILFPPISDIWQNIYLEDPEAKYFGVRKKGGLPALLLENRGDSHCIVENGDARHPCRVVQLGLKKDALAKKEISASVKIKLTEDEVAIEEYKQELLLSRTLSCGDMSMVADPKEKTLKIFFKGSEVTCGKGLHGACHIQDGWLNPDNAAWALRKVSDRELEILLSYASSPVSLVWNFNFSGRDILDAKMGVICDASVLIHSYDMRLTLKDGYQKWSTAQEDGVFETVSYAGGVGPVRLKDNSAVAIALALGTHGEPCFYAQTSPVLGKPFLGIHKMKRDGGEDICLNFSHFIPRNKRRHETGRHVCLKGRLILGPEAAKEKQEHPASSATAAFGRKNTRFVFCDGRGRIFHDGKELTTGLGLYTSLCKDAIWFDSSQAVWQVQKATQDEICVYGEWAHVPVSQSWYFRWLDEKKLRWRVETALIEEARWEIEQVNMMVSADYKIWTAGKSVRGHFFDEYPESYDILPFRFWYGRGETLAVEDEVLSNIIFHNRDETRLWRAVVENSDCLYQARLLQFQKPADPRARGTRMSPFDGVLEINPKSL